LGAVGLGFDISIFIGADCICEAVGICGLYGTGHIVGAGGVGCCAGIGFCGIPKARPTWSLLIVEPCGASGQ